MFGAFTFGSPYFGDAITIEHGAANPRVWRAFGKYEPFLYAFRLSDAQLDAFCPFDDIRPSRRERMYGLP
jgi:hypothetical protein